MGHGVRLFLGTAAVGAAMGLATGALGAGERGVLAPGVLLVAEPRVQGPYFAETVVLLVRYGPEGGFGLILNRPGKTRLSEILPDVKTLRDRRDPIYFGGPVELGRLNALVRSGKPPAGFDHVVDDVYIGQDRKALEAWIDPSSEFRMFAGYAGWAPGQLEGEKGRGDWTVLPASAGSIFDSDPERQWRRLLPRNPRQWTRGIILEPPVPQTRTVRCDLLDILAADPAGTGLDEVPDSFQSCRRVPSSRLPNYPGPARSGAPAEMDHLDRVSPK